MHLLIEADCSSTCSGKFSSIFQPANCGPINKLEGKATLGKSVNRGPVGDFGVLKKVYSPNIRPIYIQCTYCSGLLKLYSLPHRPYIKLHINYVFFQFHNSHFCSCVFHYSRVLYEYIVSRHEFNVSRQIPSRICWNRILQNLLLAVWWPVF